MRWFSPEDLEGDVRRIHDALRSERFLLDLDDPRELAVLRDDAARIASGMDDPARPPPMLWSGVPWPLGSDRNDCDWSLAVSVGGTNTSWLLVRLRGGEVVGLDPEGREVHGYALGRVRASCTMRTPTHHDAASGQEMVERIADRVAAYLRGAGPEVCRHTLLSWGFAHRVVRTGEHVLGGLTAYTTYMTKDQTRFTRDLRDVDIGRLLGDALEERLGWRRPVTVANDGVMALHYFLSPGNRQRHAQIGLFIHGTGTNFCLAEPYAVRPEGVVSRSGETYEPERLVGGRALPPGYRAVRYFVNYETGSIELDATRTRFDLRDDYPIESNVLSGGSGIEQQFAGIARFALGEEGFARVLRAAASGPLEAPAVRGPEVSRLAGARGDELERLLPGDELDASGRRAAAFLARCVVERSALHAALVLAAVTRRTGFGRGDAASGRPDLLGMEGSVWRMPRYAKGVRSAWERLAGEALRVELRAEASYAASARGPLHFTLLHDPEEREPDMDPGGPAPEGPRA